MPAPMGSLGAVGPALAGAGSPGQGISLMPVVFANPAGVQNQVTTGGAASNQPHYTAHNPAGTRFRKRNYGIIIWRFDMESWNKLFL